MPTNEEIEAACKGYTLNGAKPPLRAAMRDTLIAAEQVRSALTGASAASTAAPAVSVQDPRTIIEGIRQFGLAADGSDLRDLEAAVARNVTPPVQPGDGWQPIETAPHNKLVDLWCIYSDAREATYHTGRVVGQIVRDRHKSEQYGWFGNQSNDGVPQGGGNPDLVPVAWRYPVDDCPVELIAAVLPAAPSPEGREG